MERTHEKPTNIYRIRPIRSMNKRQLIARVQRHMGAGASRDAARAAVNAVLSSILQAAEEENKITLPHLGTFEYRLHQSRDGKGLPTPSAGQPRQCTSRLNFRPARRLKAIAEAPVPPKSPQ